MSNSHEILQIQYSQYISSCVSLTSLLSHSIIYLSGPTALSLCQWDAECYLSPDNASPSTLSILTQVGSSLKHLNKTFFQRKKKRGKVEDLVLLQCQSLSYIYTADIKDKLHFLCQKSLIFCYFLLEQHLYTSLLIANLDFLWGRTPFVLPCNQSLPPRETQQRDYYFVTVFKMYFCDVVLPNTRLPK